MIRVVLVEPEGEQNVGFVARLCKNFGVDELFLVNPKCDLTESRRFAMRGVEVLDSSVVVPTLDQALKDTDIKIATSSIADIPGDILRKSVRPWEVADIIAGKRAALVFGRESVGLTREEIAMCDLLLHIPANPEYEVLNLSHSVGIVLYEIWRARSKGERGSVSAEAIDLVGKYLKLIFDEISKGRDDLPMYYAAKRIVLRSLRDEEEARTLIRLLRKIYLKLKNEY
jgi:tRNA/rRNA methyltransferase